MTTVHFAAVKGRPLNERKGSPNTCSWAAWWTGEPHMAPFTPPDAHGGAPTRADVPELVRQAAPPGAELKWISAGWCAEFRAVQRDGVEARAQFHAQHEREMEARIREARERAADPLWWWKIREQTAQWVEVRDSRGGAGTPEWAELLGLSLPCTAEDVARAFKAKAFAAHPDRGGDSETFIALERARRAALTHLGIP